MGHFSKILTLEGKNDKIVTETRIYIMSYKKAEFKKYLECAKIVNIHGVGGAVKLESRADSPEVLTKIKTFYKKDADSYTPMNALRSSVHKGMVLVYFEGVTTPEEAIGLKNLILYAAREDFRLGKGEFFIADVLGLPVFDAASGTEIGVLDEVLSPAGQQVYVVRKPNGKTFMVPFVPEFIKKVSFGETSDAGIYVSLIEGMDDEN